VSKRYHSDKQFEEFYPRHGGKNQLAQNDMEQNYVTVTLCITSYRLDGGETIHPASFSNLLQYAATLPCNLS